MSTDVTWCGLCCIFVMEIQITLEILEVRYIKVNQPIMPIDMGLLGNFMQNALLNLTYLSNANITIS